MLITARINNENHALRIREDEIFIEDGIDFITLGMNGLDFISLLINGGTHHVDDNVSVKVHGTQYQTVKWIVLTCTTDNFVSTHKFTIRDAIIASIAAQGLDYA